MAELSCRSMLLVVALIRRPISISWLTSTCVWTTGNGTGYAVYPDITACAAAIKAAGGVTPLVGRYTTTAPQSNGADAKAWRCYSPSALDASTGEYKSGTHYCGNPALIG